MTSGSDVETVHSHCVRDCIVQSSSAAVSVLTTPGPPQLVLMPLDPRTLQRPANRLSGGKEMRVRHITAVVDVRIELGIETLATALSLVYTNHYIS